MNLLLSLKISLFAGFAAPVWLLGSVSASAAAPSREVLRTVGRLPAKDHQMLEWAVSLAAERLRESPACRKLFTALGADGFDILAATFYTAPISKAETGSCDRRHASAMTSVGGRRTVLCSPSFGELSRRQAAVTLLHEALHHAGLSEYPREPGAPRSSEINRAVKLSCGL